MPGRASRAKRRGGVRREPTVCGRVAVGPLRGKTSGWGRAPVRNCTRMLRSRPIPFRGRASDQRKVRRRAIPLEKTPAGGMRCCRSKHRSSGSFHAFDVDRPSTLISLDRPSWCYRNSTMALLQAYVRSWRASNFLDRIEVDARILEIGSGSGWVGEYLRGRGVASFTGVDLVPPADVVG